MKSLYSILVSLTMLLFTVSPVSASDLETFEHKVTLHVEFDEITDLNELVALAVAKNNHTEYISVTPSDNDIYVYEQLLSKSICEDGTTIEEVAENMVYMNSYNYSYSDTEVGQRGYSDTSYIITAYLTKYGNNPFSYDAVGLNRTTVSINDSGTDNTYVTKLEMQTYVRPPLPDGGPYRNYASYSNPSNALYSLSSSYSSPVEANVFADMYVMGILTFNNGYRTPDNYGMVIINL